MSIGGEGAWFVLGVWFMRGRVLINYARAGAAENVTRYYIREEIFSAEMMMSAIWVWSIYY